MALGKGLNSLIPPKGTKINIHTDNDSGDEMGFTTKSIDDNSGNGPAVSVSKPDQNKPAENKSAENKSAENKSAENKGGESRQDDSEKEHKRPYHHSAVKDGDITENVREIPVDDIRDNPKQPRKNFDEEKLKELGASIKRYGMIEPIIVSQAEDGKYEVIAGERRLKASKMADIEKVPVVVRNVDDQKRLEIALIENLQREDLDPIETAMAYKELMDKFGLNADRIARRVGKSRPKVSNTLRLLGLPGEIQQALTSGAINEGHAIYLLGIDSPVKQMDLFRKITMNKWTVAETGQAVKKAGGTKHSQVKINMGDEEKEDRLRDFFGTKVEFRRARKGGRIVIRFFSEDELDNIMKKIK
ncbi:ParB/RepB/Spo0J family partition protein [Candidatus Falkowbacteria bacterium]|nr:ParB/RepB/Spo0J family partition protein [Candidatus Falkowbacteria bacterium]